MVVPAFGFSVGDFVAAIQLIRKVCLALKDTGGAASEYQSLITELQQLYLLLEHLRDLPTSSATSQNHYNVVRGMACEVQLPLRAFVEKLNAYSSKLGASVDTSSWRTAKRKVQWSTSMQQEVREMRAAVTMKIVSVSLLLAIPTGDHLSRLEDLIVEAKNTGSTATAELTRATRQIADNQDKMKESVRDISHEIKFSTTRLLNICMGLATGVERLDKRHVRSQKVAMNRHRRVVLYQRKGEEMMERMAGSLQICATKTNSIVVQLLKQFTTFSKEVLEYLAKLHMSNLEIYSLLLRIQNNLIRAPTGQLEDNIKFIDVLHRSRSLPFAFFQHWEVFESMLQCDFKGKPGESKVRNGRYLIMNSKLPGEAIQPKDWSKLVFPGSEIHMSVLLARTYRNGSLCPRVGCSGNSSDVFDSTVGLVECKKCGLQFTSTLSIQDVLKSQAVKLNPLRATRTKRPQNNFGPKYDVPDMKFAWSYSEPKLSTVPQTQVTQNKYSTALLIALIRAVTSFRRLATRIRKREEDELKVFKNVHISTSPGLSPQTMHQLAKLQSDRTQPKHTEQQAHEFVGVSPRLWVNTAMPRELHNVHESSKGIGLAWLEQNG